jgi:hypothetical protein
MICSTAPIATTARAPPKKADRGVEASGGCRALLSLDLIRHPLPDFAELDIQVESEVGGIQRPQVRGIGAGEAGGRRSPLLAILRQQIDHARQLVARIDGCACQSQHADVVRDRRERVLAVDDDHCINDRRKAPRTTPPGY